VNKDWFMVDKLPAKKSLAWDGKIILEAIFIL
jgi:hypothetical protein